MSLAPSVVIVSPALADANNGNARTAQRWHDLLAPHCRVRVTREWPDAGAMEDTAMLALHARRSAAAIAAWAQARPARGLAVVLTGTDLYQDFGQDPGTAQSIASAQRLVVLQECGADALPPERRSRTRVVFQSTPALPPLPKSTDSLEAVMVGHLRAVKDPRTLYAAAGLLRAHADIRITHIGDAEAEPALGTEARATERAAPGYRWRGGLSHEMTLDRIRRAHVLVHTSAAEGGAHVIMEAIRCGTPVLASAVPGNIGMLGAGYDGYFTAGDAESLARLLLQARRDQREQDPAAGLLGRLAAQCTLRAPLFDPAAERQALLNLLQELDTAP
jgi:putative glycosyltransferase (TIGR04348 family)